MHTTFVLRAFRAEIACALAYFMLMNRIMYNVSRSGDCVRTAVHVRGNKADGV